MMARQPSTSGRRGATIPACLQLAAGMALFGSATPVSKLVGEAFPALLASGLRMVTAVLVLLPAVLLLTGDSGPRAIISRLDKRDWLLVAGIAVIGTVGFTLLLYYGLRTVPGAVGAVIMATTPAVTAAGAVLFLHERLNWRKASGLALAVAGVVVVNLGSGGHGGGSNILLGSLLVFGAVCCEAAYTLLGKQLTAELSPVAIALLAALLAGLIFAPLAVPQATGFGWDRPEWTDWLALLWWGAGTMGLGSVLWFRGMRTVAATTASGFMAVMPLSALLLAYLLLDEAFSWAHAVGMAAALAGIGVITRSDTD